MKILVTGGSGFIGKSLLSRLLEAGNTICSLDTQPSKIQHAGLTEKKINLLDSSEVKSAITSFSPDFIFHLAAFNNNGLSFKESQACIDLNFHGTLNILEGLKEVKCRGLIVPSTYYLKTSQGEETFDSPYIFSKYLQEKLLSQYCKTFNIPSVSIRLGNVFGNNPANETFIQSVARKMLKGENKIEVGNLELIRDFIYVDDVVEAFHLLTKSQEFPKGIYELGMGSGVTLREIVVQVEKMTQYSGVVYPDSIQTQGNNVVSLITEPKKLFDFLNWKPTYSLETGLRKMIDQMKKV